jgi:hypothetical protein
MLDIIAAEIVEFVVSRGRPADSGQLRMLANSGLS